MPGSSVFGNPVWGATFELREPVRLAIALTCVACVAVVLWSFRRLPADDAGSVAKGNRARGLAKRLVDVLLVTSGAGPVAACPAYEATALGHGVWLLAALGRAAWLLIAV